MPFRKSLTITIAVFAFLGCSNSSYLIRKNDSALKKTGKIFVRTLVAVPSLGLTEFEFQQTKNEEAYKNGEISYSEYARRTLEHNQKQMAMANGLGAMGGVMNQSQLQQQAYENQRMQLAAKMVSEAHENAVNNPLASYVAPPVQPIYSPPTRVQGYVKQDGTYVAPYSRTNPDKNPINNYNFPGNYNPNTGEITPGDSESYLNEYYKKR